MPASVSQSILCSIVCERRRISFRIVVTVINVETSSFRPIPSYELKNDSTLQSMFAEHGSARRRGALRRAAMERGRFTPPISPSCVWPRGLQGAAFAFRVA